LKEVGHPLRVMPSDPTAAPLVILRYSEGSLAFRASCERNGRSFGVPQDDNVRTSDGHRKRQSTNIPPGHICEYAAGDSRTLWIVETISTSVYPGVVLSFFHSGSETNTPQFLSCAAMFSKVSM